MQKRTQLFGSDKRTRYLIGIATRGPIAGRALGRLLAIDSAEMPDLYRVFSATGTITRDARQQLVLDERFFAFSELAVLLHALAGERVVVIPNGRTQQLRPKAPERLFGTPARTRVLVALHALGAANIAELSLVSGVPERTVSAILAMFGSNGIVASSKIAHDVVAALDDGHPCAAPLRSLLGRLTQAFPQIIATANFLGARKAESLQTRYDTAATAALLPMGTRAQARALVSLLRIGPMTTNALADKIETSQNTARTVTQELERYGFVIRKTVGAGRARRTWVVANESHPLREPLRRYVEKTVPNAPQKEPSALPPRDLTRTKRVTARLLPGHRLRMKILMEVFDAKEISVTELARRLRRPDLRHIRKWAVELHSASLIRYGHENGKLMLRNDGAATSAELKALVAAMTIFMRGP